MSPPNKSTVDDFDVAAVAPSDAMVLTESFGCDDDHEKEDAGNSSSNDGTASISKSDAGDDDNDGQGSEGDSSDTRSVISKSGEVSDTMENNETTSSSTVEQHSATGEDNGQESHNDDQGGNNTDDSDAGSSSAASNDSQGTVAPPAPASSKSVEVATTLNEDDETPLPVDSFVKCHPASNGRVLLDVVDQEYGMSCNVTTTTTGSGGDNDSATSNILSPSSVSSVVDSVLENLEQQKEAWSAAHAATQSQYQDRAIVHATEDGVAELLFTLRTYQTDGIVVGDNNPNGHESLLLRVRDFHRARFMRRQNKKATKNISFGIYGLFQYVTDLRLDLEWAEDAAWRRVHLKQSLPWMDFQMLHKRKYRQSYFVYLLLAVWTVMLCLAFALNDFEFAPLQENPFYGPPVNVLRELGALDRNKIVIDYEWYRLVTSLALNAGLIHFALNVAVMIFLGSAVEQAHGFIGTVMIFLLSGIGGNVAGALFLPQGISVGASGGLFGLIGVCVADIMVHWELLTLKNHRDPSDPAHKGFNYWPVVLGLSALVVLYIIMGLAPIVDNYVQLGGFFYGVCLTIPILKWLGDGSGFFSASNNKSNHTNKESRTWADDRSRRTQSAWHMLSVSVALFLLTATTLLLAKGQRGEIACKNCRYVSCAPFPWWKDDSNTNATIGGDDDGRWWHCDDCDFAPLDSEVTYEGNVTTLLDMTCPDEEVVTIDLLMPNVTEDEIQKSLGGYCRQYC